MGLSECCQGRSRAAKRRMNGWLCNDGDELGAGKPAPPSAWGCFPVLLNPLDLILSPQKPSCCLRTGVEAEKAPGQRHVRVEGLGQGHLLNAHLTGTFANMSWVLGGSLAANPQQLTPGLHYTQQSTQNLWLLSELKDLCPRPWAPVGELGCPSQPWGCTALVANISQPQLSPSPLFYQNHFPSLCGWVVISCSPSSLAGSCCRTQHLLGARAQSHSPSLPLVPWDRTFSLCLRGLLGPTAQHRPCREHEGPRKPGVPTPPNTDTQPSPFSPAFHLHPSLLQMFVLPQLPFPRSSSSSPTPATFFPSIFPSPPSCPPP